MGTSCCVQWMNNSCDVMLYAEGGFVQFAGHKYIGCTLD